MPDFFFQRGNAMAIRVGGQVALGFYDDEKSGIYASVMEVEVGGEKGPSIQIGMMNAKVIALDPGIKEKFQELCKEAVMVLLKKMQEDIPHLIVGKPEELKPQK
jgi:hypothetical protein